MTYYNIAIEPFLLHGEKGTLKTQQNKVVEEASEAFAEVEIYRDQLEESQADDYFMNKFDTGLVLYECCDTIQAACNLMYAVGASPAEVMGAMSRVHEANAKRGRYKK